ncbi:MAG: response regulator [Verrucomicrobiota bacterium]
MHTSTCQATVMIIDDEPENLNLLGETLRHNGWDVRAFPDGKLALAAAREEPPDVVLLDIRMPGMDGYEVCRQFKADAALRAIPILFISALSAAEDIVAGFQQGGVDYITKPFRQVEVLARVQTHLALRRAHVQLTEAHARLRAVEHHRDLLADLLTRALHQPLQQVRKQLETLEKETTGTLPADRSDGLQEALDGTRVLTEMIATGDSLNRLVSDGVPLHRMTIPVHELFDSASCRTFYPAGASRITTHVAALCPALLCDVDLTERVITNLLANALTNSPAINRTVLTAGPVPNGVRIWVRDDGPAMPANQQKNFANLGKVDLPSDRQSPSINLGLFFCKLAVEAQGGDFGVEDHGRKGRNFWFTLPAAT